MHWFPRLTLRTLLATVLVAGVLGADMVGLCILHQLEGQNHALHLIDATLVQYGNDIYTWGNRGIQHLDGAGPSSKTTVIRNNRIYEPAADATSASR